MTTSLLSLTGSDVLILLNSAFFILGGIAVFMVGMNMMGSGLETAAGKSMRRLMSRATKNRFTGVVTGAAVTAIVNSSAATTVMIVGFVNVGLMTLVQAASVIMGANIGTTISAFIMALSAAGNEFSVAAVFALIAFAGFVLTLVGKTDKIKRVGTIFEGVGLIFIGLNVMSGAVHDLLEGNIGEAVGNMFVAIGNGKPSLTWEIPVLFILGVLLTAAMQSSAALTAIVISLASANPPLISLQMAMCIILGANVGTCLTSLLSSMGASVNAKRTAMVHLLFNLAGCFIFIWPVAFAGEQIANLLSALNSEWQIAVFHMVFNLLTTLILLPFINYLVKLACLLVPEKAGAQEGAEEEETLDKRLLKTPAIAVGQTRKELMRMGDEAFNNYKLSLEMLLTGDLSHKEQFAATEKNINESNRYITSFLVKLSLLELGETDEKKVSSFYHVASDIERIGDYAENIVEYAEKMVEDGSSFSDEAKAEIMEMDSHLSELYKEVGATFLHIDLSHMPAVENEENETDNICTKMQNRHLARTTEGKCTPEAGAVYLQLALNMERIGDHMHNIANSINTYARHGNEN